MNLKEIIKDNKHVIVYFYADWCFPCKTLSPLMENIKNEYSDILKVVKINSEEENDLVMEYNIRNLPTLIFFKNEEIYSKHSGMINATALYTQVGSFIK
jgi:thioredoxin 1